MTEAAALARRMAEHAVDNGMCASQVDLKALGAREDFVRNFFALALPFAEVMLRLAEAGERVIGDALAISGGEACKGRLKRLSPSLDVLSSALAAFDALAKEGE